MSKLVIVESPAKAKTIKKYLGSDFDVVASMGHVRDLPENRLSVDVKKDFKPKYEVIKGKEKLVEELKEAADKVMKFFLQLTRTAKEKPFRGIWLIYWDWMWKIITALPLTKLQRRRLPMELSIRVPLIWIW